jgi:quercetin 2,3-dioxygenase
MEVIAMPDRRVAKVFGAAATHDGDGVSLRRAFPGAQMMDLDPFLLLDELGPTDLAPGEARGFPDHPHRGFETITYLLSGEMEHRDSWGNAGVIRAGDVQWMTAGSGLVHSEMPGKLLVEQGGTLHGFQLWLNLPKRDKMTPPRYQDLRADLIPLWEGEGVKARVIAGESHGIQGLVEMKVPILYLHLTLQSGATFTETIPRSLNTMLYVIAGSLECSGTSAGEGSVVVLDRAGDQVQMLNPGSVPAEVLVLAGEPIGEPVVRYGPFVMNSKEEIAQAVDDYRAGRMARGH